MEQIVVKLLLCYLVIISVAGYAIMGIDKHRAIKHAWRISERTLILVAFLGGGIGSLLGMLRFHHKTRHIKFVILTPLSALIYVALTVRLLLFL